MAHCSCPTQAKPWGVVRLCSDQGTVLLGGVDGVDHISALPCGLIEEKRPIVHEDEPPMNTNRHKDRQTSFNDKRRPNASAILCPWYHDVMGACPPGARASRPHKSSRSFGHLLHRNQPAAAPCLCFGRAHAVPAGRAVGCNIAGKLSGNRRDSMRAGRPRSRGCRPDGEVEGIRRATSLKAGLSPLGNSRLPASRAPAPRDWADPSRRTIN